MADISSQASGNYSAAGTWVGGVPPGAGDNAIILNTHTVTMTAAVAAVVDITINAGGELDTGNYDLTSTGVINATGIFRTGNCTIKCAGLNFLAVNSFYPDTTENNTIIELSGNYSSVNNAWGQGTLAPKLIYKTNGAYTDTSWASGWWGTLEIENGITLSPTNLSNLQFKTLELDGTIAIGVNTVYLQGHHTGAMNLNATGDFTGSGLLTFITRYGCTVSMNRASAYSVTGTIRNVGGNVTYPNIIVEGDWTNAAAVRLQGSSTSDAYLKGIGGIVKCVNLYVYSDFNHDIYIDNSVGNTSYEVEQAIDYHSGSGSYTRYYTKGTGSISGIGTAASTYSWAFDGESAENIIINAGANTIYQASENFTTDSMTVTAGTFDNSTVNGTSS